MTALETVTQFLDALGRGAADEIDPLLHDDVVQEELPNAMLPTGVKRSKADILAGIETGKAVISSQTYEITSSFEAGNRVALEIAWKGVLAIPMGAWPVGHVMRGRIAMFVETDGEGKIVAQRNYDCFDLY